MGKNQLIAALIIASLVPGCSSAVRLEDLSDDAGHSVLSVPSSPFPLQALVPEQRKQLKLPILRVYIEGDGHAWATSSQPSLDPTPHNPMVALLAIGDATPAVYLARPCQYIQNDGCDVQVWTDGRFAPGVIQSMSEALDMLKNTYQSHSLELIGYSGGGAIALLLAAQRDDVSKIQTMAGNIDPEAWVVLHGLSTLKGSLDPLADVEKLKDIEQRHLVGRSDTVVPPSLARGYARKLQGRCVEVVEVDAAHDTGWQAVWVQARSTAIQCP